MGKKLSTALLQLTTPTSHIAEPGQVEHTTDRRLLKYGDEERISAQNIVASGWRLLGPPVADGRSWHWYFSRRYDPSAFCKHPGCRMVWVPGILNKHHWNGWCEQHQPKEAADGDS